MSTNGEGPPGNGTNQDDDADNYSALDAVFGSERADKMRQFAQRLQSLEDRLEQEYLEQCTDPYIAQSNSVEMEQSGGAGVQSGLRKSKPYHRRDSSAEEANFRASLCEVPMNNAMAQQDLFRKPKTSAEAVAARAGFPDLRSGGSPAPIQTVLVADGKRYP